MKRVFISFAKKSRNTAEFVKAALCEYGGETFVYTSQTDATALQAGTLDKLRTHCHEADLFIQILEGSDGTYVEEYGASILELELKWFMEQRHHKTTRKVEPLILNKVRARTQGAKVSADEARFDQYIKGIEQAGLSYQPWTGEPQVVQVTTHWFIANRVEPMTDTMLLRGYLDVRVAEPSIDQAIRDTLRNNSGQAILPQKYLFTSPIGVMYWRQLTDNHAKSVRTLYDTFDFSDHDSDYIKRILAHISSTFNTSTPLSFIALGCGDGRREAHLTLSLSRAFPNHIVRLLLVDVSKTMLSIASGNVRREFKDHSKRIGVEFAVADFEHDETLRKIIHEWSYEHPCIVLFLGNTLGNIDVEQFFDNIASSLKPKDLLISEVVLAGEEEYAAYTERKTRSVDSRAADSRGANARTSDPKTAEPSRGADHIPASFESAWQSLSPQNPDDRFEFIYSPIRSLGIEPNPKHYKVKSRESDLAVSRTFAYEFFETAGECSKLATLLGLGKIRQSELLALLRVDAFFENGIKSIVSKNFKLLDDRVFRRESRLKRGGRKVEMGIFLASRI